MLLITKMATTARRTATWFLFLALFHLHIPLLPLLLVQFAQCGD